MRLDPAQGIRGVRFEDLSQLTINHNGAEFMLTRETITASNGGVISSRYRLYSGGPDQVFPPGFRRMGPNGEVTVERIIGHTPLPNSFLSELEPPIVG